MSVSGRSPWTVNTHETGVPRRLVLQGQLCCTATGRLCAQVPGQPRWTCLFAPTVQWAFLFVVVCRCLTDMFMFTTLGWGARSFGSRLGCWGALSLCKAIYVPRLTSHKQLLISLGCLFHIIRPGTGQSGEWLKICPSSKGSG